MTCPLKVEISESQQDLEKALKHAMTKQQAIAPLNS